MSLSLNLRHLEAHGLRLKGELSPAELDLDPRDEVIRVQGPLRYELEAQKVEDGLLIQGALRLLLQCQCVRCLKVFTYELSLPDWTRHLPLAGEDAAPVVNDCVLLTPYLREDILLEFPQHPLCEPECRGLSGSAFGPDHPAGSAGQASAGSAVWDELNKLKF